MNYDLESLPKIEQEGIALDIDETLAWTIGFWVKELQKLFGNPENLSINEIISKYRYTQNVPYWQTKDALEWMGKHRNSNEIQTKLSVIKNSDLTIKEIIKIIPVVAYITTRPQSVIDSIKLWLKQKGFPNAPIICRPNKIPNEEGNKWKAKVLEKLYPKVRGIIDDNRGLIDFLSSDYKGHIFLYNHNEVKSDLKVIPCIDWETIYKEIKKVF